MRRIGIAGCTDDLFFRIAQERFQGSEVIFEKYIKGAEYDAVLVHPDLERPETAIKCGILIIPDEAAAVNSEAKSVVSYGMSPKNTVTISSSQEQNNVVALQRDVVSLGGTLILRQEFPVVCDLPPYETLALASLMVITGVLE